MADKQKAGDNSVQVQAGIIVNGIDEKRVREIVDERLPIALQNFSEEAYRIAAQRNSKFSEKLIDKIAAENALLAFSDPSFLLLLTEAQKRAASTEREPDYDLLSELMLRRFKEKSNRNVRASISRAVEIVDQISDEALLALTVIHAATSFVPISGNIAQGLDALNALFSKLIYEELPTSNDWMDNLDILNTVRISSFGKMRPLEDYWAEVLEGYNVGGIAKNSEEHKEAISKLQSVGINEKCLVEHELVIGNIRLEVVNKKSINNLSILSASLMQGNKSLSPQQAEVLREIYDISNKSKIDRQKFIDELEGRPNLKLLREWWNDIQHSLQITGVGKVLAHSNAQRIDRNLPPLE